MITTHFEHLELKRFLFAVFISETKNIPINIVSIEIAILLD
jgi:hypothetical protein